MTRKSTIVVALVAVLALSAASRAAINGTDHDLRSRLGITRICLPCHVAHNGENADQGPLWNHAMTDQTFTRHGENVTLGHSSKMCLSCHDGVTAVGNYGGITTSGDLITGDAKIGTDLTDDHPIGVDYNDVNTHIYRPIEEVAAYLEDDKVECGSCHYAHGGQDGKFLRVTTLASELCAKCHTFADLPAPPP